MEHTTRRRSHRSSIAALALALTWSAGAARAESKALQTDVTQIDIDDLMNVNVSIASKTPEPFARVPAAVYVIRGEDLQRTGAYNLAEALRMVPGFHVERSRSNTWQLSARGFNGGNANKLLVLRDGRTVYSNFQSGVYWDVQDTLLDNVDRIEVVRGPGGTLWGTNAVNGVVNIISKRAEASPGGLLKLATGRELRSLVGGRYGFALGEEQHVRISGKISSFDEGAQASNTEHQANDGLDMRRADFRSDWSRGEDQLRLQGEFYDGGADTQGLAISLAPIRNTVYNDRADLRGGHLLGAWERSLGGQSSLDVRTYYDYTSRKGDLFADRLHTGDLETQYRFPPRPGHDAVVGAGYRLLASNAESSFVFSLATENRTDSIWSLFGQDEITLIQDRLWLTLGTRIEHNDYSGFEVLPNARLALAVDERSTAWLAASRAVRTPSILDVDIRINQGATRSGTTPVLVSNFGTEHFRAEQLFALESGYRTRPAEHVALDFALFANFYDDLRSFTVGRAFAELTPLPPHAVSPIFIVNENRVRSYGAELSLDLELAPWWMLRTSYTHLSINAHQTRANTDGSGPTDDQDEGIAPRNQLWLRSSMNLPFNLSLDLMGRYVGRLPASRVRRYTEADLRLAWLSGSGMEVALVGHNLLHSEHAEYTFTGSAIERDVFLQLSWRFK